MRWRLELVRRPRERQRLLPFCERAERLDRRFKGVIAGLTIVVAIASVAGSGRARLRVAALRDQARQAFERLMGLEPDRSRIDSQWRLRREQGVADARGSLEKAFEATTPEMRHLLNLAGMG